MDNDDKPRRGGPDPGPWGRRGPTTGAPAELAAALDALAAGGMVVVADDRDRENEGDLVMAAEAVTQDAMAFFLRYGSGIVCTPMSGQIADRLGLPLMVSDNTDAHRTAFTVTVDHRTVGTGISAADRAATVRALADPHTGPDDLRRPGHVFPLRSRPGGVLRRAGHTEAATDLLEMAGRPGVAVITELVADDGTTISGPAIRRFAADHAIPFVSIEDVVRSRRAGTPLVRRTGAAKLPLDSGRFNATAYTDLQTGVEHLALTLGDVRAAGAAAAGALVRVHSECLTGDVFGSRRCDCGTQLSDALELISAAGCGAVVYLRGQEGRGIGLGHKLQAYALQEQGKDTVDANTALGLPVDSREYGVGAAILADLGIRRIQLITNNPHKYGGLDGHDLELIGRVATRVRATPDNIRYLSAKRDRMGHDIDLNPDAPPGQVIR